MSAIAIAIATSRARQRYDAFTLTLHWLTAACMIFLLVSSACLIFRAGLPSIPRCAVCCLKLPGGRENYP